MLLTIIASVVAALAVALIMGGLILSRRDETVSSRLGAYLTPGQDGVSIVDAEVKSKPFAERIIFPIAQRLSDSVGAILPNNQVATIRRKLLMAGNPSGLTVALFIGIKGMALIGTLGVALAFGVVGGLPANLQNLGLLTVLCFCAFFLPDFWLSSKITARQRALTNSLPDALDLLTIANAAGLSFENAIQEICSKWDDELAHEFERVLRDVGMGVSRRQAITDFGDRTGVPDIISFASAIKQAETLGISIGRTLQVQSEEMRTRRRQRAQETANQAPIKMMFPLVFLIFPAIFAVLLGPAVPQLLTTFDNL